MESKITKEQVKRIAQLSKLDLTEEEIERFAELFTDTLVYINVLDELDTKNVKPTYQVTGLKNVFMKGHDNKQTLKKDEALKNAKEVIKGMFATKGVFDR